jgi:hypothetical protein
MKGWIVVAALCAPAVVAATGTPAPYAGQQAREIKALSAQDVQALLGGQGAGMAKAAELNGYPGPAHVLELADRLGLSAEQRAATERLMATHKARAVQLGAQVVEAERALDRLFAARQAEAGPVSQAAARIGELQAALRAEHLNTHLEQTRLLSAEQVRQYQSLRGYGAAPSEGGQHRHHHR